MTMTVTIAINGDVIHHLEVTNRGPLGGQYAPGDYQGGGGLRRYSWHDHTTGLAGRVVHQRHEGAPVLATIVLDHLHETLQPVDTP